MNIFEGIKFFCSKSMPIRLMQMSQFSISFSRLSSSNIFASTISIYPNDPLVFKKTALWVFLVWQITL